MVPLTITVKENGPYLIADRDSVRIVDHEGNAIPVPTAKKNIALCRCGGSVTKPFCDGTHSRIGFRGAGAAQREFDRLQGE